MHSNVRHSISITRALYIFHFILDVSLLVKLFKYELHTSLITFLSYEVLQIRVLS